MNTDQYDDCFSVLHAQDNYGVDLWGLDIMFCV